MDKIKQLIDEGRMTDAIELLNDYLATHPDSDEALYLRGRAHRKAGRIREAINDYLASAAIRPDGPAARAYRMEIEIMTSTTAISTIRNRPPLPTPEEVSRVHMGGFVNALPFVYELIA